MKLKNNMKLLITCDSGAAAGKTTAAKYLSKRYNLNLLTSGLLYRYVAYKLMISKKNPNDISFLKRITKSINPKLLKNSKLYTSEVTKFTSEIAKIKKIRMLLKKYQKNFAKRYNRVCIEGRDISYAILPNADLKFYFECILNVASKRRWKELKKRNKKIKLSQVKKSLKIRNFNDKNRKHNPLIKLPDSIVIRTDILNKSEMIRKMSKEIELKLNKKI